LYMLMVVAAALIDDTNRVLLAQRPEGKALAGLWEFPGGKLDDGETPEEALVRELREELGILTAPCCLRPVSFVTHPLSKGSGDPDGLMRWGMPLDASAGGCNPQARWDAEDADATLLLLLYAVRKWHGEPQSREGQALQWLRPQQMMSLPMPPADRPLVLALMDAL
jgi:8-oxo-dGTP diphosphatase